MATRRNGPVKTFMPDPSNPDSDPSTAAASAPIGGLSGFGFSLATVAPAKGKGGSSVATEAVAIEWPDDVAALAKQLEISLPDAQPSKGKSPAGALIVLPKGSPWAGSKVVPAISDLKRRDAAAVWAVWVAHGCSGQTAAMAAGQALPLTDCFRSLIGAELNGAAFKRLWAGSGDRTSILGQLAAHTGKVATLILSDFTIRLT